MTSSRDVAGLAERYGLGEDVGARLAGFLDLLLDDPLAPTSIKGPRAVLDDHLADSLIAIEGATLAGARDALDLGSGAGLPGLPLAMALPQTKFTLLESSSRKCRFLARAVEVCGVANAEVVHARAESFDAGLGRYDVVTARAVAPLPVTLEYAAPLLRAGGTVIAWRGRRDVEAERAAARAASTLGLGQASIRAVRPYPGATNRHLYEVRKTHATPARFPRRPGMALKRPLGAKNAD